jgi:hypothetical protein
VVGFLLIYAPSVSGTEEEEAAANSETIGDGAVALLGDVK